MDNKFLHMTNQNAEFRTDSCTLTVFRALLLAKRRLFILLIPLLGVVCRISLNKRRTPNKRRPRINAALE